MFNIGSRIREIRKLRNFTASGLAEEIGVSQSFISGIEAGTKKCSLENLDKICQVLGVTLYDFFAPTEKREFFFDSQPIYNTARHAPEVHRVMEKIQKLPLDKLKVLESVLDTWIEDQPDDDINKPGTDNTIDIPEYGLVAEQTLKYKENLLALIINKEYDIDYMCQLLDNGIIVLTDEMRNPLSPELRKGFIQFLRNYNHPELLEQTIISEDDPMAAHRQGHMRTKHDEIKPEFMAMRRIIFRLNKVLAKYLTNKNSKKTKKSRL